MRKCRKVFEWYLQKGVKFQFGQNEETELTEKQVLEQCKMYIAAVRIADEFGCAAIGIQYQQGLKGSFASVGSGGRDAELFRAAAGVFGGQSGAVQGGGDSALQ